MTDRFQNLAYFFRQLQCLLVATAAIAVLLAQVSFANAQTDKEESKPKVQQKRLPVKVTVVDPDGKPIAGALVEPNSMVLKDRPGSTMSWVDREPEKVANLLTDENGVVTVTYPDPPFGTSQVVRIGMDITHSSFVEKFQFCTVADKEIKIELDRGFRIAASAIDAETGDSIKRNLFATTNRLDLVDWEQKSIGMLVSPIFGKQECHFRLMEVVGGKAVRFSDLITVEPDGKSRMLFRNVKLSKSVVVRGELDANVPRPVNNGVVSICVASVRDQDRATNQAAWRWMSFANIKKDGTFELPGIPSNCDLQVIAVCDGWVNVPINNAEMAVKFPSYAKIMNNNWFAMPQLFEIDEDPSDIEIAMQPMGSCTVSIVDDSGKPIVGANVRVNPNQRFFHSGFTTGFESTWALATTLEGIRKTARAKNKGAADESLDDEPEPAKSPRTSEAFRGTSDENGKVEIVDLPATVIRGSAYHADYDPGTQRHKQFTVSIKSGERTEITVTLVKPKKE